MQGNVGWLSILCLIKPQRPSLHHVQWFMSDYRIKKCKILNPETRTNMACLGSNQSYNIGFFLSDLFTCCWGKQHYEHDHNGTPTELNSHQILYFDFIFFYYLLPAWETLNEPHVIYVNCIMKTISMRCQNPL